MHHEVRGMSDRAPVPAHGPHDHAVLIEHAGVLQLALMRIAERHVGRVDQRWIGADGQQPQLPGAPGAR